MNIPALILGFLLSTLYAAAFHFWRGSGPGRLLLYLVLAWIGFWAGQYLAEQTGFTLIELGQIHIIPASLGSLLFLFVGHWLSLAPEKK
jgi:uncharacterized membrane protein YeaQ/YmgE (transglycosylase-associated protein family)